MILWTHQSERSASDLGRALDPAVGGAELLPLAVHRDPRVREAVGSRTDCPMAALIALGQDRNADVLRALLRNVTTPSTIVSVLASHRDPRVADIAMARLRHVVR